MKNKTYLLFAIFVTTGIQFTALPSAAQLSLGLAAGYDYNYQNRDISGRSFSTNAGLSGYAICIPLLYRCNSWLSLGVEPSLCKKNHILRRTDSFAGIYESYHNTYFQLPLTARYMIGSRKYKGFVELGGYGGWWLSGRIKGVGPNIFDLYDSIGPGGQVVEYYRVDAYEAKYHFDQRKDNRFEWGWVAGIGAQYSPDDVYSVFIDGRYTGGLSDCQKKYMTGLVPAHNHTWYLSIGGVMKLSMRKRSKV